MVRQTRNKMVQLCKHPTQMAHLNSHTMTLVPTVGPLMDSQSTQMSTLIVSYVTHGHQEMVHHPSNTTE